MYAIRVEHITSLRPRTKHLHPETELADLLEKRISHISSLEGIAEQREADAGLIGAIYGRHSLEAAAASVQHALSLLPMARDGSSSLVARLKACINNAMEIAQSHPVPQSVAMAMHYVLGQAELIAVRTSCAACKACMANQSL